MSPGVPLKFFRFFINFHRQIWDSAHVTHQVVVTYIGICVSQQLVTLDCRHVQQIAKKMSLAAKTVQAKNVLGISLYEEQ